MRARRRPAYRLAKLIIKLINNLAGTIDGDPAMRGRLKVVFLPDYNVSLAERLIPASDVSNQISTAGYEASGTSNMKFMMNGALTMGTRDGATIEMAEEAGEENFFLFGLTAEQVAGSRGWYNPHWHYDNEPETRAALDLIFSDHFSRNEPGVFDPLRETLLTHGDYYMHLADLRSYLEADQRLCELYADPDAWAGKAILNVAGSGKFSSDRTIAEYAAEIWRVKACPCRREASMTHSPLEGWPSSRVDRQSATSPDAWQAPRATIRGPAAQSLPPFPPGYRASGVLLHVTSLPSPYGIGDVGPAALAWIDRLHEAGQSWWQALPLGPTGYGDSPYQSLSSFAGNGLLISPDALIEDGLLRASDVAGHAPRRIVDYEAVIRFKHRIAREGLDQLLAGARPDLGRLRAIPPRPGALAGRLRAVPRAEGPVQGRCLPRVAGRSGSARTAALAQARREEANQIDQVCFAQFLLFRQGERLKAHARAKGVRLIGDLPFFVSPDSSDVWANPELFLLDGQHRPRFVGGVPPDYFGAQGQLWGNPVYDWEALRRAATAGASTACALYWRTWT